LSWTNLTQLGPLTPEIYGLVGTHKMGREKISCIINNSATQCIAPFC